MAPVKNKDGNVVYADFGVSPLSFRLSADFEVLYIDDDVALIRLSTAIGDQTETTHVLVELRDT